MNRRLVFGDVIRVDPAKNPHVTQPDDRRWMVVSFDDRNKWTLLYIGPVEAAVHPNLTPISSHWTTLHGFVSVDE